MSQEMYGATGRVGNKTYYRRDGKTIAREVVTPKNPKTSAQTLQRVIVAQVGKSYAKFKDICDHSFEGYTNGSKCAARFRQLNMRTIRDRAAELQRTGVSLYQFYQFAPINSEKWAPNALCIAQGSLPKMDVSLGQAGGGVFVANFPALENSYAGIVDYYGLQRGDQLTFVNVEKELDEYVVKTARIILDPRNEDGSGAAMTTALVADGQIQKPSRRNQGSFSSLGFADGFFSFHLGEGNLVAAAIIVSRKGSDGEWYRSNTNLVVSEAALGSDLCSLMDAVDRSYSGSDIDLESEYYLNNAGVGGTQGDASETPIPDTPSTDPTYNNTVSINGAQQNISGGSASATAPVNTIVISGTNLAEAPVTGRKSGASSDVTPTKTATSITFSDLNLAAGESFTVKKNGATWFTVASVESSGGNPDFGDQG